MPREGCRLSRGPRTSQACPSITSTSGRRGPGSNAFASPSSPDVSASISAWLNGPSSAIFPYLPVDKGGDLDALVAPHHPYLPQELRLVADPDGQIALRQ